MIVWRLKSTNENYENLSAFVLKSLAENNQNKPYVDCIRFIEFSKKPQTVFQGKTLALANVEQFSDVVKIAILCDRAFYSFRKP